MYLLTAARLALALFAFGLFFATPGQAQERTIVIGTGPVAGTYYPVGGAICRVINQRHDLNGLTCLVKVTEGSAENLEALRLGTIDLALVQSDWQYHAFNGSAAGQSQAFTELRALLSLQPQVMTLVAGANSGILALTDLAGKKIALGPAGSGVNDAARAFLTTLGLEGSYIPVEGDLDDLADSMCAGEIDAFLLATAHPNKIVGDAVDLCDGVLIDMAGSATETLIKAWPFYIAATIPAGTYSGSGDAISSYGIVATLVTTAKLPDQVAYDVVQAVIEGLDEVKRQYPALSELQVPQMIGDGASAPNHPGAQRYFDEKQLR